MWQCRVNVLPQLHGWRLCRLCSNIKKCCRSCFMTLRTLSREDLSTKKNRVAFRRKTVFRETPNPVLHNVPGAHECLLCFVTSTRSDTQEIQATSCVQAVLQSLPQAQVWGPTLIAHWHAAFQCMQRCSDLLHLINVPSPRRLTVNSILIRLCNWLAKDCVLVLLQSSVAYAKDPWSLSSLFCNRYDQTDSVSIDSTAFIVRSCSARIRLSCSGVFVVLL